MKTTIQPSGQTVSNGHTGENNGSILISIRKSYTGVTAYSGLTGARKMDLIDSIGQIGKKKTQKMNDTFLKTQD